MGFFNRVGAFFSRLNPFGDESDRSQIQRLETENAKQDKLLLGAAALVAYLLLK